MGDIINFPDVKENRIRALAKEESISKMASSDVKRDADLEFYKLLDLFLSKHYPDAYWKFDLFINGELD